MERIMLGYDGSPASAAALRWVAARAARRTARVDVVTVLARGSGERPEALRALGDAEHLLRERAPGTEVELHRLEGAMPDALIDFGRDADLFVIGVSTGHPVRAALAGFLPLRLSVGATVPVCMVPAGWVPTDDAVTVGVAGDGSSDAALAFAADEAAVTSGILRVVHAWLMPTPTFEGATASVLSEEDEAERHRRVLDAAAHRVRVAHPLLAVGAQLVRDSRASALMGFASQSSLLVIGTHHRGPLEGGLLGSVAQEILWRTDCPICIVP